MAKLQWQGEVSAFRWTKKSCKKQLQGIYISQGDAPLNCKHAYSSAVTKDVTQVDLATKWKTDIARLLSIKHTARVVLIVSEIKYLPGYSVL